MLFEDLEKNCKPYKGITIIQCLFKFQVNPSVAVQIHIGGLENLIYPQTMVGLSLNQRSSFQKGVKLMNPSTQSLTMALTQHHRILEMLQSMNLASTQSLTMTQHLHMLEII